MKTRFASHRKNRFSAAPQRGAVLITALLLLVVLTLLGTSSIQNTVLQERMAGNVNQRNLAFQAAESSLREAEAWLADPVDRSYLPAAKKSNLGSDDVWAMDAPKAHNDYYWWSVVNSAWWKDSKNSRSVTSFEGDVALKPRYVIEHRYFRPDDLTQGYGPPEGRDYHRITALGVGKSDSAQVTLQSQFVRRYEYKVVN